MIIIFTKSEALILLCRTHRIVFFPAMILFMLADDNAMHIMNDDVIVVGAHAATTA